MLSQTYQQWPLLLLYGLVPMQGGRAMWEGGSALSKGKISEIERARNNCRNCPCIEFVSTVNQISFSNRRKRTKLHAWEERGSGRKRRTRRYLKPATDPGTWLDVVSFSARCIPAVRDFTLVWSPYTDFSFWVTIRQTDDDFGFRNTMQGSVVCF